MKYIKPGYSFRDENVAKSILYILNDIYCHVYKEPSYLDSSLYEWDDEATHDYWIFAESHLQTEDPKDKLKLYLNKFFLWLSNYMFGMLHERFLLQAPEPDPELSKYYFYFLRQYVNIYNNPINKETFIQNSVIIFTGLYEWECLIKDFADKRNKPLLRGRPKYIQAFFLPNPELLPPNNTPSSFFYDYLPKNIKSACTGDVMILNNVLRIHSN